MSVIKNYHFIPQNDFCLGMTKSNLHKVWDAVILERSTVHQDLQRQVCDSLSTAEDKHFCSTQLNRLYPDTPDRDIHHKDASSLVRSYYDAELWNIVSEMYAEDIALYEAAGGKKMTWDDVQTTDASDSLFKPSRSDRTEV